MKTAAVLLSLATATTLAACGSDGDTKDPAPKKCTTATASGTQLTRPGSTLCLGSSAVVRYSYRSASAVLQLTVSGIERAPSADVKQLGLKAKETDGKTLYYVRGTVTVVRSTATKIFGFDPFNQVGLQVSGGGRATTYLGYDPDKCKGVDIDDDAVRPGATSPGCRYFLVDSGTLPSHVTYTNIDDLKKGPITDESRISWYEKT